MSLISDMLTQMVQSTPTIAKAVANENNKDAGSSSFKRKTEGNTLNQLGLAIKRR